MKSENRNESLLVRSLLGKPVSRTPVWLMRQAGRYLPEYRQIRSQVKDFLDLCKNPQLAVEVALQPLRRFSLDAAILFTDILTIPDAMGLGLRFIEGEGPCFERPLRSKQDIESLRTVDLEMDLDYVFSALRLTRKEIPQDLPLIGFAGSPWTLAAYMVEGKSTRDFKRILTFMYNEPEVIHLLLQKLTHVIIDYLSTQVLSGADVLMIFDTWGGILSTASYQSFSLYYMNLIVASLKGRHPDVPIVLFTKGGGQWLSLMAASGCDALGLDWTCDLGRARQELGGRLALQGNLDPTVLLASIPAIRREVQGVLAQYGQGSGLVFNLGHGITPDVHPDHVEAMVEAVHEFSPAYHLPLPS